MIQLEHETITTETKVSFKKIQKTINQTIANNLLSLFKERNLTPTLFMHHQKFKDFFSPQHFNRLFNHPDKTPLSAAAVALMCDFFGVTLHSSQFRIEKLLLDSPPTMPILSTNTADGKISHPLFINPSHTGHFTYKDDFTVD